MALRVIRTALRKHAQNPRLYALARRAMLIGQFVTRTPDEADLRAFKILRSRKSGLFVDIGASGGQTAVAISFILPKFDIVSIEPNPTLWPELDFIGRIIGKRFSYLALGLGSTGGRLALFIPQVGNFPITTRASLDRASAELHRSALSKEMGTTLSIAEMAVDVATFDSLRLDPAAVKIDVEGFELEVLKGMSETLKRSRPIVMIESHARNEECAGFLRNHAYAIRYRSKENDRLTVAPVDNAANWFAVPNEQLADFGL